MTLGLFFAKTTTSVSRLPVVMRLMLREAVMRATVMRVLATLQMLPSDGTKSMHWGHGRCLRCGPEVHTYTGWGANCNCHFGSRSLCKTNLSGCGDLDVARRLCKVWLLMGLDIPASRGTGRDDHVLKIARHHILIRDEAEMDAIAAAQLQA